MISRTGSWFCRDTSIISERGGDPQKHADYLHEIDTASDAIQRYVKFTRQYEDLGIEMPIWRSLPDIIKGVENSRISVYYESEEYVILGDPMLERVFYNLMDNTIRHAEGATGVIISCEERNGDLAIIWEYDRAGILVDQKKRIFERFFGKIQDLVSFSAVRSSPSPGSPSRKPGCMGRVHGLR